MSPAEETFSRSLYSSISPPRSSPNWAVENVSRNALEEILGFYLIAAKGFFVAGNSLRGDDWDILGRSGNG
jgi:hypothetical protein